MKKKIIFSVIISFAVLSSFSQGWWYRVSDVNLSARTAAVGFAIGSGAFVGTGFDSSSYRRNFSSYNSTNDTWNQIQSMGGSTGSGLGRNSAAAFVIGNKAYIVGGQGSNPFMNDTWEYNPTSDSWSQKANFAGSPRRAAAAFTANNMGYITCGQDANGFKNDLWMFDPSANSWTSKAAFPGTPRRLPVAFTINNWAYVGTGDDGAFKKDFYKYIPTINSWTPIADYGGTARYGATAFILGTDGFVGTGYDNTLTNRKDFWKYTTANNTWTAITNFGGTGRSNAVGFAVGGYGYVGTGYDSLPEKDFWKYDPLSNGIEETEKLRSSVKLYPNPMHSSSHLEFDPESLKAFGNISFHLYDITGKEIKTTDHINTSSFQIERMNMSKGLYVYKLIADDKLISSGKLMVE
ncbi:MAG: type sorting protein [Bacteroidota bacterium]|jgi:N-acetylneuraminic acid mutarotase|nr:type sorting protein [Bacteroidota bacterium]